MSYVKLKLAMRNGGVGCQAFNMPGCSESGSDLLLMPLPVHPYHVIFVRITSPLELFHQKYASRILFERKSEREEGREKEKGGKRKGKKDKAKGQRQKKRRRKKERNGKRNEKRALTS